MMRIFILITTAILISACVDNTTNNTTQNARLPTPFIMVGQSGPGQIAANELSNDGIAISTNFAGRLTGIKAFCSGNAHAVLMDSDFTSAERKICKDLGGSWSAIGTQKGATIYVKHSLGEALIKQGKTTFLG